MAKWKTTHYRIWGNRRTNKCRGKEIILFAFGKKEMDKLTEQKEQEGYKYIDESILDYLILQYPYHEESKAQAEEVCYETEDMMNDCLGLAGNGFWEGRHY